MNHIEYVQILTAMFVFWNAVRIFTYIPTIAKLLHPRTDAKSYSLLTWGSWVLSNGTFALMLLESNHGVPDKMFWMNAGNTIMCFATCVIIFIKGNVASTAGFQTLGSLDR